MLLPKWRGLQNGLLEGESRGAECQKQREMGRSQPRPGWKQPEEEGRLGLRMHVSPGVEQEEMGLPAGEPPNCRAVVGTEHQISSLAP